MIGIISYKDLDNWDFMHPQKVQKTVQRISRSQQNFQNGQMQAFIVNESPYLMNSSEHQETLDTVNGCYFILLGNLHNETPALKLVLDNYRYLNRRTKDTRFFMPGFIVDKNGLVASRGLSHEKQFEFYEDGFLETVEWLEEGNSSYRYSENMEMVLLPFERKGDATVYDFNHMLHYDLDSLLADGRNLIEFISQGIMVIKKEMTYGMMKTEMDKSAVVEQLRNNVSSGYSSPSSSIAKDVFISYCWKDQKIVQEIAATLEKAGLSVWIDQTGINGGDRLFKRNITKAIKQAKVFLFFSSVDSNKSDSAKKEVNLALKYNVPIIPVKLDDSEYDEDLEYDLSSIYFINLFPEEKVKDNTEILIRSVKDKCGIKTESSVKEKKKPSVTAQVVDDNTPKNQDEIDRLQEFMDHQYGPVGCGMNPKYNCNPKLVYYMSFIDKTYRVLEGVNGMPWNEERDPLIVQYTTAKDVIDDGWEPATLFKPLFEIKK